MKVTLKCALDGCPNTIERQPSQVANSKTGKFYCSKEHKAQGMCGTGTKTTFAECEREGCENQVKSMPSFPQRFCSVACRDKGKKATWPCAAEGCPNIVERYVKSMAKRATDRVFCSQECQDKAGCKPRRGEVFTCARPECDETFYQRKSGTRRYCSKACFDLCQWVDRLSFTCQVCGKEFQLVPGVAAWRTNQFCSRDCLSLARIKRPLDRMHNGKPARLDPNGYVLVWQPDNPGSGSMKGWVYEHRLVAEGMIGRYLEPGEEVHHVREGFEAKSDNRPENLEVLTKIEHAKVTGAANWGQLRTMRSENERLRAEVEALRSNPEFMDRLKASVEEHAGILARLADG